jgi:hypothetical protein
VSCQPSAISQSSSLDVAQGAEDVHLFSIHREPTFHHVLHLDGAASAALRPEPSS